MARLADEVINRIKQDVSLLRLVESQGHKVTKQGKDYAIRCPFHDGGNTPSLIISPKNCVLRRYRASAKAGWFIAHPPRSASGGYSPA